MLSMMRPLLTSVTCAEGHSRASSCFITSGKAASDRNVPNPVVEDEPSATTVTGLPALSLARVRGSWAPSERPFANFRHLSDGEPPVACAWAPAPPNRNGSRKNTLKVLIIRRPGPVASRVRTYHELALAGRGRGCEFLPA